MRNKRALSIVLVLLMLFGIVPTAAYATDAEAELTGITDVSTESSAADVSGVGDESNEETASESALAEAADEPQADSLVSPAAATANGLMTGDTVITTGSEGHQFFYGASYYWGSNMSVALYKRGSVLADWQNGTNFFAWCASYGKSTPAERQLYLLESGQNDADGKYYYTDEGLDSMRIDFDWALCCIRAAQEVSGRDYGSASFPKAYRWALEIAIRCRGYGSNPGLEAEKVNADSIPASAGALCAAGVKTEFEALGWNGDGAYGIRTFYKTIQAIYTKADGYYGSGTNSTYHYVPREKIIARQTTKDAAYRGNYLVLAEYSLEDESGKVFTGVTAKVTGTAGVEAAVSGSTLTVRIPISAIKKNSDGTYPDITWNVELSTAGESIEVMLLGKPVDSSGRLMTDSSAPQNIMLFTETTVKSEGKINGETYKPYEEKANVKVVKTDTAGKKLQGMSFTLYKASGNKLSYYDSTETDNNGVIEWKDNPLGTYFLVENTNAGFAPYQPSSWRVTGAGEARYTTVGGKDGWLLELTPGTTAVTVEAKNRTVTYGFSIKKVDQNGNGVAGVRFTVSDDAKLLDTVELTTDESGTAQYEYSPEEVAKLNGGGSMFLKIYEVSPKGQAPKDPAKWKVTGGYLSNWVEDEECWFIRLDSEHPTFTLEAVNTVQKGALSVIKSPFDGTAARGEEFTFRLTSNTNPAYDKTFTVKITDDLGITKITDLDIFNTDGNYITYTLTELSAPKRYKKANPVTFTFETEYKKNPDDATFLHEVVVRNEQVPFQITVIKSSETGEREGFTFILTDNRGNRWERTSDIEGWLSFTNLDVYDPKTLKPVIYTLTEKATGKYLLPEPVVINAAEYVEANRNPLVNTCFVDVSFYNEYRRVGLTLHKENVDGEGLENAVFALEYSDDGGLSWKPFDIDGGEFYAEKASSDQHLTGNRFSTDASGEIRIEGLIAAWKYRLTEIKAPEGYMLLAEHIELEGDFEERIELTAVDEAAPLLPETGGGGFTILWMLPLGIGAAVLIGMQINEKNQKERRK